MTTRRETLRDAHRNVVGYIDLGSDGVHTLRDRRLLRVLGTYDGRNNLTRNGHRERVGFGNLLATLITQDNP